MGLGPDHAQELEAIGDGHPHVQNDGVGTDVIRQLQPRFGVDGRRDLEPLELEHARERIGDGAVVVYYQDCFGRRFGERVPGRGNHRIILKPKEIGVKLTG